MDIRHAILSAVIAAVFPAFASAAPDNTLGMAIMSATVASDATLTHGSGATGAESDLSVGGYLVTFDRNLTGCSCTASAGQAQIGSYHFNVIATANCPGTAANNLRVRLNLNDGSPFAGSFHAIVFCPK